LLLGRNLWRSSVVTLGNQTADRITVLPNMNGIIAHIDSVRKPPQTSQPVLDVWTSEGRHRVKWKITVHETEDPKPKTP
jgi:hypothetical protein